MYHDLPFSLLYLLAFATRHSAAIPNFSNGSVTRREGLSPRLSLAPRLQSVPPMEKRDSNVSAAPAVSNSSSVIWLLRDTFDYKNFFDNFGFYNDSDPTHGTVTYVDGDTAFAHNLSYISSDNKVIMKGDDTNWLQSGQFRESVRVSSYAQYNTGLFILDTNTVPWGCGVWPAFWTLGSGTWPQTGEIDIIEGVHANEHNQVTWHTNPGCNLTPTANFTGSITEQNGQPYLDCEGGATFPGCGILEWSKSSYGPAFDAQGGGVFAMKWDQDGISVWSFYRVAVPQDIIDGNPDPSKWPTPVATLAPDNCNPLQYFQNHSIVFDITFCGDWAGNSYATSGCPGTCPDRIMDPGNFVNATWSINTLHVYERQGLAGHLSGAARHHDALYSTTSLCLLGGLYIFALFVGF